MLCPRSERRAKRDLDVILVQSLFSNLKSAIRPPQQQPGFHRVSRGATFIDNAPCHLACFIFIAVRIVRLRNPRSASFPTLHNFREPRPSTV